MGYYAVQRVEKIVPDPADSTHSFAILDRGSELSFELIVPRLRPNKLPYETGLPLSGGNNTAAVRHISQVDFANIISEGLREDVQADTLPRTGPLIPSQPSQFDEGPTPFVHQQDRTMVLSSRALRDQSFARQVKTAYQARCAMSGLAQWRRATRG